MKHVMILDRGRFIHFDILGHLIYVLHQFGELVNVFNSKSQKAFLVWVQNRFKRMAHECNRAFCYMGRAEIGRAHV